MSEVDEAEEKIEVCTKDLLELSKELEKLGNMAWVAAKSFKMLIKAKEDIEKARKLMFSPPKVKIEPSRELQEKVDAWLGDDY